MRTPHLAIVPLLPLAVNLSFALYNGVLGVLYRSQWYGALGLYYAILTLLRLAARPRRDKSPRPIIRRWTGGSLLLMSILLAGIAYMSIRQSIATRHGDILMITISTYTFYKITVAVIQAAKGKNTTPEQEIPCRLRLVEVAVSLFAMQRSMLVSFGDMATKNIVFMNSLTGGGVFLFVLWQAILLIRKEKRDMATSKIVKVSDKIADKVTDGYKAVETAVVDGYTKIEDAFVEKYLTHEGESITQAKARLKKEHH